jgi:putative hydrolase of HD superfamily
MENFHTKIDEGNSSTPNESLSKKINEQWYWERIAENLDVLKEKKVVDYYLLCNKLKNIIRTGWIEWKVQRERVESIAEHIFWVQMLALAMNSEYEYDIDIMKVIYMLAIHELWETIIWDLTQFQITKEEKEKIEHEAVHNVLSSMLNWKEIEDLFLEFDAHKTPEAKFAYQCDKLECDIQCKLYDQEWCVDLSHQEGNKIANNKLVKELLKNGESWSDMWLKFWQKKYQYDDNFMSVSNYVKDNYIDLKDNNGGAESWTQV